MVVGLMSFTLLLIFAIPKSNVPMVPTRGENVNSTPIPIEAQPGITNVHRFSDLYNNLSSQAITNVAGKKTNGFYARPSATPKPLPYPRIAINYSLQTTNSIRGIGAGRNDSFILVSVEIRNFGYNYFDADPRKFRLGSLEPILNVSTGNMLDAVVPNNSETQGDLIFLTGNAQRESGRLSYVSGEYKIIYGTTRAATPGITVVRHRIR